MSTKSFDITVSFNMKTALPEEVISEIRKVLARIVETANPLTQNSGEREFTKVLREALEKGDDEFLPFFIRLGMRDGVRANFIKELKGANDGLVFSKFSPWAVEVTPRGN